MQTTVKYTLYDLKRYLSAKTKEERNKYHSYE